MGVLVLLGSLRALPAVLQGPVAAALQDLGMLQGPGTLHVAVTGALATPHPPPPLPLPLPPKRCRLWRARLRCLWPALQVLCDVWVLMRV